jgi:lipoprotein signal peptidase
MFDMPILNSGVAFGLWEGIPLWVVGIAHLILIICAVKTRQLLARTGLFLMVIGGAGNLWLRFTYGGVIDTLSLTGLIYNNVWDYLILLGLIVYGYTSFIRRR